MECAGSIPEADLILSALIALIHVDCTGVCLQLFAVVQINMYYSDSRRSLLDVR